MVERAREEAKRFFEGLWSQGDYWELETAEADQRRYGLYLELLSGRRYARALDLGAGAGTFTRLLALLADEIVALEVSEAALERAYAAGVPDNVHYRQANLMDWDPLAEGPWDLVLLNEVVYYLGWLYTAFDVFWIASRLHEATRPGGRLLLGNTYFGGEIMDERLIRTYRDLFRNVGFEVEREEEFAGEKHGVAIEALVTLFRKPVPG